MEPELIGDLQARINRALEVFSSDTAYVLAILEDAADIEKQREANRIRWEKRSRALTGRTYAPRITSLPVYIGGQPHFQKCLHPMTEENIYQRPGRTTKECRECGRERMRRRPSRRKVKQ